MKDNKKDLTLETFKFEARDVYFKLMDDMKLNEKFKDSFNYVISKLPIQKIKKDIEKLKWDEGKNYDWAVIKQDNIHVLIRKYRSHFTIYFKNKYKITDNEEVDDYFYTKYGCFTFNTNKEKIKKEDLKKYDCDSFVDINENIEALINFLKDNKVESLWNSYSFKRPEHVEIKNVWNGGEDLSSIDTFIFACEELFSKHLELFAQIDMYEKIKTFNIGDKLGVYEITGVSTQLTNEHYHEPYYHMVGLKFKNQKFPDKKEEWADVYSLSRYYYEDVFYKL